MDINEVRVLLEIIGCVIDPQCVMLVYLVVGINGQVKHILVSELMSFLAKKPREQMSFGSLREVLRVGELFVNEQDTIGYIHERMDHCCSLASMNEPP